VLNIIPLEEAGIPIFHRIFTTDLIPPRAHLSTDLSSFVQLEIGVESQLSPADEKLRED